MTIGSIGQILIVPIHGTPQKVAVQRTNANVPQKFQISSK
jgi:hypothetical protein